MFRHPRREVIYFHQLHVRQLKIFLRDLQVIYYIFYFNYGILTLIDVDIKSGPYLAVFGPGFLSGLRNRIFYFVIFNFVPLKKNFFFSETDFHL